MISQTKLAVEIAGIKLKNPVMTASGTFGYGLEFSPFIDLNRLGAMVLKGITLRPRLGNPTPRIIETSSGILNSIGLQNIGVEALIKEKLPSLKKFYTPIIINVSGNSIEEYIKICQKLEEVSEDLRVVALEINISCPNIHKEGNPLWGKDAKATYQLVSGIRKNTSLPLIIKLTPNVTDIQEIAQSAEEAGADALSLINTLVGMAVDIDLHRPKLGNICGGLSGPAIKPIALWMVWQVFQKVKIPIIGMGGIMNTRDALEFMLVGARAVSIGTANLINPNSTLEIIEGIEDFCLKNEIKDINDLVGKLKV